jgi:hypothetical protein
MMQDGNVIQDLSKFSSLDFMVNKLLNWRRHNNVFGNLENI